MSKRFTNTLRPQLSGVNYAEANAIKDEETATVDTNEDASLTEELKLEKQLQSIEEQMGAVDQKMNILMYQIEELTATSTKMLCETLDTIICRRAITSDYKQPSAASLVACVARVKTYGSNAGDFKSNGSQMSYREAAVVLSYMRRASASLLAISKTIDREVVTYKSELQVCHRNYLSLRDQWMACISQLHAASDHADAEVFGANEEEKEKEVQ